ncbi:MAG: hypothetical protein ACRD5R_05380, partial [Candidatus Acidiferrales bacterium]
MSLDGRIEARVGLTIPIYLASTKGPDAAELVVTENVSTHGVRATSKRRWQPGEQHRVTPLTREFDLQARVIYCQPLPNNAFSIGLKFQYSFSMWWERSVAADRKTEIHDVVRTGG